MKLRSTKSLSTRITLANSVLVVAFVAAAISMLMTIRSLKREVGIGQTTHVRLALTSADLERTQSALTKYLSNAIDADRSEQLVRRRLSRLIEDRRRAVDALVGLLREVALDKVAKARFQRAIQDVDRIRTLERSSHASYDDLLRDQSVPLFLSEYSARSQLRRNELRLDHLSRRFSKLQANRLSTSTLWLDKILDKIWKTMLIFGLLAAGLGILMTVAVNVMMRSIGRLRNAVRGIALGDSADKLRINGPPEIEELASEFRLMSAAVRDRTELLLRNERLVTAGKMALVITHEVRNPLSTIGLHAELLEEELAARPDSEELRELSSVIVREVDRLAILTEGYLQLSASPVLARRKQALVPIAASVVDFVRDGLKRRGIVIDFFSTCNPSLLLDEGQLRQALINLIANAADAVDGGADARIEVAVTMTDKGPSLLVRDNGPGIAKEVEGRLFDAFVSGKKSGTGLGLAITHKIVTEHAAVIEVTSENKSGATFQIVFL